MPGSAQGGYLTFAVGLSSTSFSAELIDLLIVFESRGDWFPQSFPHRAAG